MFDHDPDFKPYDGLPEPPIWKSRDFWRGCRDGLIIGAVVIGAGYLLAKVFFAVTDANAHDAIPTAAQPLGWAYGWECCSLTDCSALNSDEIGESPKGYLVRRTGEVITYADTRIKRSKDELYHRCTPGGNEDALRSICLYVPDRGF